MQHQLRPHPPAASQRADEDAAWRSVSGAVWPMLGFSCCRSARRRRRLRHRTPRLPAVRQRQKRRSCCARTLRLSAACSFSTLRLRRPQRRRRSGTARARGRWPAAVTAQAPRAPPPQAAQAPAQLPDAAAAGAAAQRSSRPCRHLSSGDVASHPMLMLRAGSWQSLRKSLFHASAALRLSSVKHDPRSRRRWYAARRWRSAAAPSAVLRCRQRVSGASGRAPPAAESTPPPRRPCADAAARGSADGRNKDEQQQVRLRQTDWRCARKWLGGTVDPALPSRAAAGVIWRAGETEATPPGPSHRGARCAIAT